ncbi:MAG: YicC family protein, partial [Gemmatimonadetes bacterium]|nr:YicC family protein [Gemmatimonadota bacterium]
YICQQVGAGMIASMTGFGKGVAEGEVGRVIVEMRSVNGRYGDVMVRMPRSLSELESRIKERVLSVFTRGRLDVSITLQDAASEQGLPVLKPEVLAAYLKGIEEIRADISGEIDLMQIAQLPQLFTFEVPELDSEALWKVVSVALCQALDACRAMCLAEGEKLARDLRTRISVLDEFLQRVEALAPERVETVRTRLEEKLAQLLTPEQIDESRLLMEIALLADRSDITEECVRFHSHNAQFLGMLDRSEAVGRRLNFLLQEMLREANTMGSKAGDATIAHVVVDIKEEIEKLKEQVQNIE